MILIEHLVAEATDWTGGTWANRIDQSASLLFLHGYLTDTERQRITNRIEKQFRDGIADGRIVARPVEQFAESAKNSGSMEEQANGVR